MTRIPVFLLVLLLIVVAGCSSTSSSAEESEPATPEPTPTETAEGSDDAEPSLGEGAGELAELLPEEVGGLVIEYEHTSGEDAFSSEGITPEAQAFLERVGAQPEDVASAFGFAFDAETETGVTILAFRVEGADESTLRTEFLSVMEESGTAVGEEMTVGGKTVHAMGEEGGTEGFLYAKDDVVFLVSGEPEELAEEALAALP